MPKEKIPAYLEYTINSEDKVGNEFLETVCTGFTLDIPKHSAISSTNNPTFSLISVERNWSMGSSDISHLGRVLSVGVIEIPLQYTIFSHLGTR